MPAGFPVTITLTAEELRRAEEAAKRLAVPVEVFARNAVLNATRDIKLTPPQYKPHQLTWIHRKARAEGKVWTEEELRERGLPLYWSKAWVEDQLARGHSYPEIAINAGGYQVMAISKYLRLEHGISKFVKKSANDVEAIHARIAEGATRSDIMREFGLSDFMAARYFQAQEGRKELELRFQQEVAAVTWPATREDIAAALFEGVKHRANNWVSVRLKWGWLIRVKQGLYQVAPEFRPPL